MHLIYHYDHNLILLIYIYDRFKFSIELPNDNFIDNFLLVFLIFGVDNNF